MKLTKTQLRRIIKEEVSNLNEVSMTNVEIVRDIERWVSEIDELKDAAFLGNLETPDMGGPESRLSDELHRLLGDASDSLGHLRTLLK